MHCHAHRDRVLALGTDERKQAERAVRMPGSPFTGRDRKDRFGKLWIRAFYVELNIINAIWHSRPTELLYGSVCVRTIGRVCGKAVDNRDPVIRTPGVTPAMATGFSYKLRDLEWIVGLIDANTRHPRSRG